MSRQDADFLLAQAVQCTEKKDYQGALVYYEQSLQIMLNIYKNETNEEKKAALMLVLEHNMAAAEATKGFMQAEAKKAQEQQGSSIFSFFTGSSNPAPAKPKEEPVTKISAASRSSAASATAVPDFHDYTTVERVRIGSPAGKSSSKSTNQRTATKQISSAPRAVPGVRATEAKVKLSADSGKSSPKLNEYEKQIMDEMLDKSPGVKWEDIAGLAFAKQTLQEAVILPNLRPDLFTGLRKPPKGVLLFGPPGTGKTLLAKAVATESGFCFFSITASSVTSKYLGEGEKLMKALFELARMKQPSVIFFDEIDALMSTRKENEHEASRRLKTEFMTQVDGAATATEDRILISKRRHAVSIVTCAPVAATNIPWEIDEAVLRRLAKRIYVPLPDPDARRALIIHLLSKQSGHGAGMSDKQIDKIVSATHGYSGSDLSAVCHEAAMGPIRELGVHALRTIKPEDLRPLNHQDFLNALVNIKPSVSQDSLQAFSKWAQQYGVTR